MRPLIASLTGCVLLAGSARATVYVVAETGGDFTTIQAALDVVSAGDTD